MKDVMRDEFEAPKIVDRSTFQAELDALRVREKTHTREGDVIAAARRRLPMVEVAGTTTLVGERGAVTLLDVFEGRRMLIAYYFMWHTGHPAPEQCEGCTWVTSQVRELSYIHSRDVTYAVFCQGPYQESARYRNFMDWEMPWYSAQNSLDTLLVGRRLGRMHIVCYLRQGSNVFETYWTTSRGVEAMDNSYRLLDLTVFGRQETWEDSPTGWPQGDIMDTLRSNGRPTSQWSRLKAGYSDDLGTGASAMERIGNARILFIAGFGPIVRDVATSRKLYSGGLGIPFKEESGNYLHTEGLKGAKSFALWPLSQAAQSCFGKDSWPDDIPAPQAWLEFDVDSVENATAELESQGCRMLVQDKKEPWGQIVSRFISPEGLLLGITFTPSMR